MAAKTTWRVHVHRSGHNVVVYVVHSQSSPESAYVYRLNGPPSRREVRENISALVGRGMSPSAMTEQIDATLADYEHATWPQWMCSRHDINDCFHIKAVQASGQ